MTGNGTIKGVFDRFTDGARRVLTLAQEEARSLHHGFIGTEHILLGLIEESDGLGARALRSLGITMEDVRQKVEEIVGASLSTPGGAPPFTPRSKKVLELALREALQLDHSYIDTEPSCSAWCGRGAASPPRCSSIWGSSSAGSAGRSTTSWRAAQRCRSARVPGSRPLAPRWFGLCRSHPVRAAGPASPSRPDSAPWP